MMNPSGIATNLLGRRVQMNLSVQVPIPGTERPPSPGRRGVGPEVKFEVQAREGELVAIYTEPDLLSVVCNTRLLGAVLLDDGTLACCDFYSIRVLSETPAPAPVPASTRSPRRRDGDPFHWEIARQACDLIGKRVVRLVDVADTMTKMWPGRTRRHQLTRDFKRKPNLWRRVDHGHYECLWIEEGRKETLPLYGTGGVHPGPQRRED